MWLLLFQVEMEGQHLLTGEEVLTKMVVVAVAQLIRQQMGAMVLVGKIQTQLLPQEELEPELEGRERQEMEILMLQKAQNPELVAVVEVKVAVHQRMVQTAGLLLLTLPFTALSLPQWILAPMYGLPGKPARLQLLLSIQEQ